MRLSIVLALARAQDHGAFRLSTCCYGRLSIGRDQTAGRYELQRDPGIARPPRVRRRRAITDQVGGRAAQSDSERLEPDRLRSLLQVRSAELPTTPSRFSPGRLHAHRQ